MKPVLSVFLISVFLAACANEDISVTGISRECAIAIAEGSCKEYPQRYSLVERAVWLNRQRCWEVNLTDGYGNGKSYRINAHHRVVSVTRISSGVAAQPTQTYQVQHYQDRNYPRPYYYTPPPTDYSEREFYFRDGDYYERPRRQYSPPPVYQGY